MKPTEVLKTLIIVYPGFNEEMTGRMVEFGGYRYTFYCTRPPLWKDKEKDFPSLPTDDEIEKEADKRYKNMAHYSFLVCGFVECAKWMRDTYHPKVDAEPHKWTKEQLQKLVDKVKEAWTPDTRSFEEAEKTVVKTVVDVEKIGRAFMKKFGPKDDKGWVSIPPYRVFDWFVNELNDVVYFDRKTGHFEPAYNYYYHREPTLDGFIEFLRKKYNL